MKEGSLFKAHRCKEPEVHQEIKKRELKLENLINRYRIFLFTFFFIADSIVIHLSDKLTGMHLFLGVPGVLIIYFALYKLHRITKKDKPKPALKYITVVVGYLFIFGGFMEAREILVQVTNISLEQYLLVITILFITINTLSALKIQKQVILFSAFLGVSLNVLIHSWFGSQLVLIFYTSAFILLSGFFNLYISGFIFQFLLTNYRLNQTMDELKNANEEIKSQNEEIKSQNDELETQNDYLAKQRDEISHQRDEISNQKKQITSSIEYASLIQKAVLATDNEIREVTPEYFIIYRPKDIVSGDFYWFRNLDVGNKKYRVFTAVDCTGHGVPGAFMSMLGTSFLNEIANENKTGINAAEILNGLRKLVKEHLHQETGDRMARDGMDTALCMLDYDEMKLQYAGANNPMFIIRNGNGSEGYKLEEYKADRMPIGIHIKEKESFTNHEIKVQKGDIIYLFSDGYVDQFGGEKGDKFKMKRFRELIQKISHLPLNQQQEKLEQTLNDWMGETYNQLDDITILGVKI
jgi:serine phosphatase RsbU (regulator of sigma subunit)